MILTVLGFGGHVLELTVGHLLADKLSHVIRSLAPEGHYHLEAAITVAWQQAVDHVGARLRTGDQRAIASQMRTEGARLLADAPNHVRVAAINALIRGDAVALKRPLGSMIASSVKDLVPADRAPFEDALPVTFVDRFAGVLKEEIHAKAWKAALLDILRDLHLQTASLSAEQASSVQLLVDAIARQTNTLADIPPHLTRMEDASRRDATDLHAAVHGSSANLRADLRDLGQEVARDLDAIRALVQLESTRASTDGTERLDTIAAEIRRVAFTWQHDVAGRPHLLFFLLRDPQIQQQPFLRIETARYGVAESLDALLRKVRASSAIEGRDDVELSSALIRILRRSRELLAPIGSGTFAVALWRALGEDAVTLVDSAGDLPSSDQEWVSFLVSNPILLSALRRDTPYTIE